MPGLCPDDKFMVTTSIHSATPTNFIVGPTSVKRELNNKSTEMEIKQINSESKGYFKAVVNGLEAGRMTYTWAGKDKFIVDHTDVNPNFKGKVEHGDSLGNKGIIHDLECHWMTAGSGIIHQEMPKESERMLGCQLWVNLPAREKMVIPAYGDITHDKVTLVEEENAVVRIIAGTFKGNSGVFEGKYVKVKYLDVDLASSSTWTYAETPNSETLFIYLLDGTLAVDETLSQFENKSCAILFSSIDKNSNTNDAVEVRSGNQGARFVLLAAKPLHEPVAWGGPIVMNTNEELDQAFKELDNGTFIKHKV